MNKKDIKAINPRNLGWVEYKLNSQEMDYVWRCIENKKENYNSKLAGNISGSYVLQDRSDWFYINTVLPLMRHYHDEFGNMGMSVPVNQRHPYYLHSWWVNYQKQNEFNPTHNHSGVYSFALWMKIPFSFTQQNKKKSGAHSNVPLISGFEFNYFDILGERQNHLYKLSPEQEGVMVLFPSKLSHTVYPFYDCDEDRFSVSGNVSLNTTKVV